MKRLHIHIKTKDLDGSIDFYAALFGKTPDRREADYAKWLLDDPCAHISVSTHSGEEGVDHAGISLESREDLDIVADRLRAHGTELLEESETTCCYAKSNKFWALDPQGAVWELFQTFADSKDYGQGPDWETAPAREPAKAEAAPACCGA